MRGKGGEGVYFVFLKKYIRRICHDLTFLFLLKFVKLYTKIFKPSVTSMLLLIMILCFCLSTLHESEADI